MGNCAHPWDVTQPTGCWDFAGVWSGMVVEFRTVEVMLDPAEVHMGYASDRSR